MAHQGPSKENDPFHEFHHFKNDPFGEKAPQVYQEKEKPPAEPKPYEKHEPHKIEKPRVEHHGHHYGNDPFYEKKSHEIDPYKEKH